MVALRKNSNRRLTYREAGVDIDAGDEFVKAILPAADRTAGTHRPGAMGGLGGFGALFDLKAEGYVDPILVSGTDGVGTKLRIAIETNVLDTVGIDLVAMCVNDVLVQGAEPLFFLDYFACSQLNQNAAVKVVEGIAAGCRLAGAALVGGETAEMPGFYYEGDFDLAGFAVGAVERSNLLPRRTNKVCPGDSIVGIASSGVHSNGFSLVRRLVDEAELNWSTPAPFAKWQTLGEAFLEPTKIYVKSLIPLLKSNDEIKALAHITGSGHVGKLQRVLPPGVGAHIQLGSWEVPSIFGWLRTEAGLTNEGDHLELLKTFNCGIGMVAIVQRDSVRHVVDKLEAAGEKAFKIGEIEERGDTSVRFTGDLTFAP